MKLSKCKCNEFTGAISVEWSRVNQAWIVSWNKSALMGVCTGSSEELLDYLRIDLALDIEPIRRV